MQNFEHLATIIVQLHTSLRGAVAASVNRMMTMRNWMIGMYIVEYEQKGEDRAKYGDRLLRSLSERLTSDGIKGMSFTNLNLFRQFYRTYPEIIQVVSEFLRFSAFENSEGQIIQKASEQLLLSTQLTEINIVKDKSGSPEPALLLRHFSYSHFVELLRIQEPTKRSFYEKEGIKGCWSVPQLKRQIESLLYERTGLSANKKGVVEKAHIQNVQASIDDVFRDPYILEFTGLPERYEYSESDLETALIGHIQYGEKK